MRKTKSAPTPTTVEGDDSSKSQEAATAQFPAQKTDEDTSSLTEIEEKKDAAASEQDVKKEGQEEETPEAKEADTIVQQ